MGRNRNLQRAWALALAAMLLCCGAFGVMAQAKENGERTVRAPGGMDSLSDPMDTAQPGDNESMLDFTREEAAFIASGREVTVGFYEDTKPLAYVDKEGNCGGVYIELLNYVKEASGVNLVFQPISRDIDWQDLVKSGGLDFFMGISSRLAEEEDPNYRSTDAFFSYDNVLIARSDCAFSERKDPVIAMTKGRTYLNDFVAETLEAGDIRFYPSAKDCLLAVSQGEADGTVLNRVEYNYQSKNARFAGLIQRENYRVETEGGLVTSVHCDEVMFSTVNRAVGLLSEELVDSTIANYLDLPYESTVADGLYIARYPLMAMGVAIFAIVTAAVAVWRSRRRQRAVMDQVREHERQQLRILAALSRNYDAIYYTNLDGDSCEEVRINESAAEGTGKIPMSSRIHTETMRQYVEQCVQPEYYEVLAPLCDPRAIIERFREQPDFLVRYQVKPNEQGQEYIEIHMVDVSVPGGEHAVVFGTRCIDAVVKAETEQRQLLQDALAAANKANTAKSDFVSKMSHNIRTPINAIIGMTAIAAAHLDDTERVKDALGKISSSGRYLQGLINEVLDMSEIEAGLVPPLQPPESEGPQTEEDRDQLQDFRQSDYTGSHVLLVEDNSINREIAREILEMAGLEVEDAENGRVAVDKVMASESGYYRMIFMDVEMPVMSGYEAAMAIRSLDRSDALRVPIIAMTANAFVEDVRTAKAAGMNAHLSKPIDFEKLNGLLKKYLG